MTTGSEVLTGQSGDKFAALGLLTAAEKPVPVAPEPPISTVICQDRSKYADHVGYWQVR
jgi:hypothetical protein